MEVAKPDKFPGRVCVGIHMDGFGVYRQVDYFPVFLRAWRRVSLRCKINANRKGWLR